MDNMYRPAGGADPQDSRSNEQFRAAPPGPSGPAPQRPGAQQPPSLQQHYARDRRHAMRWSIGLTLARKALTIWGIEVSHESVACAIENAELNGIANAAFFAGEVGRSLEALRERAGEPDVVVVDPPRAGLSAKIVRRIIEAGPSRIVYVSCNPTTLAPNAAQLVEAGYELKRVSPVDMFPQTPHIECVAVLDRR